MPSDYGYAKGDPPPQPNAMLFADPDEPSGPKYPLLRLISVIFKVLAVIAALIGVINALMTLAVSTSAPMSQTQYGSFALFGVILSLVYGTVAGIYFLAMSEGILVFIDIEENTRMTNELLQRVLGRSRK